MLEADHLGDKTACDWLSLGAGEEPHPSPGAEGSVVMGREGDAATRGMMTVRDGRPGCFVCFLCSVRGGLKEGEE